jgi:hypothetical protein
VERGEPAVGTSEKVAKKGKRDRQADKRGKKLTRDASALLVPDRPGESSKAEAEAEAARLLVEERDAAVHSSQAKINVVVG